MSGYELHVSLDFEASLRRLPVEQQEHVWDRLEELAIEAGPEKRKFKPVIIASHDVHADYTAIVYVMYNHVIRCLWVLGIDSQSEDHVDNSTASDPRTLESITYLPGPTALERADHYWVGAQELQQSGKTAPACLFSVLENDHNRGDVDYAKTDHAFAGAVMLSATDPSALDAATRLQYGVLPGSSLSFRRSY
jgi:hypothetical protein